MFVVDTIVEYTGNPVRGMKNPKSLLVAEKSKQNTAYTSVKDTSGQEFCIHNAFLREAFVKSESRQIDMTETIELADKLEAMIEELKLITGSNGIGARKIHGKKENSVSEELHAMLCSISRIKMSAKEHAAE